MSRYIVIPEPRPMTGIDGKPALARDTNMDELLTAAYTAPVEQSDVGTPFFAVLRSRFMGAVMLAEFGRFVRDRLKDLRFGSDLDSILMAREIGEALDKANGVLELPESHWKKLAEATKQPMVGRSPRTGDVITGYDPDVAHNHVEDMLAIRDASTKDPRTAGEPDAEPTAGEKFVQGG